LFADGLFDINAFAVDLVAALENGLVHTVIIIKFDKSKSTRFAGIFFGETGDCNNDAKLFKVGPEILFRHVLLETSNKDLLDGLSSLGFAKLLSWGCSLCFNLQANMF
jgi:hypothetical protein